MAASMVCLDARHAKKALDMKVNKTDANDAEGLAHLVRAGWYREVRVKSRNAMLVKALLGARSQLLNMSLSLENQIRGILKTFGRIVPKGAGGLFDKNVRALITDDAEIAAVITPLLQARGMARSKCAALDSRLIGSVQADVTCRRLMTMPGVGPLTAMAYVAALEKPDTFKRSPPKNPRNSVKSKCLTVDIKPARERIGNILCLNNRAGHDG
jgi:transposase